MTLSRWRKPALAATLIAALALLLCGASLHDALRAFTTPQLTQPAGWPAPKFRYEGYAVSRAGFELGRQLFYEPRLSRDGSTSCASCHQQFAAFAHFDHRVSHGIGSQNGVRNAPGLFNLAWQPAFMWDGAVHHLELQPLAPLTNPVEMDQSLEGALSFLRNDPSYVQRFERAFGSPGVDSQRLLRALTQFLGTLISAESRYDQFRRGEARFSALEQRGLQRFRERCASCHAEPLFTDGAYRNDGLDTHSADAGRALISAHAEDQSRFRTPSLRNVDLTPPYMHDGRFNTLEQVLAHYDHGIQDSPTLDPKLRGYGPIDAEDRRALIAFLKTLSDERFIHDTRFAEPPRAH